MEKKSQIAKSKEWKITNKSFQPIAFLRNPLNESDLILWRALVKEIRKMAPSRVYLIPIQRILSSKMDCENLKHQLIAINAAEVEWSNGSGEVSDWGVSTLVIKAEVATGEGMNTVEIELSSSIERAIRELKTDPIVQSSRQLTTN